MRSESRPDNHKNHDIMQDFLIGSKSNNFKSFSSKIGQDRQPHLSLPTHSGR